MFHLVLIPALALAMGTNPGQAMNEAHAGDRVPTLEEVRAKHEAYSDALRTLVFYERVTRLRNPLPNEDERLRENLVRSNEAAFAHLMSSPQRSAASRAALESALIERSATVEPAVLVTRLNRALCIERRTVIDWTSNSLRQEDRDLRDVRKMARENRLDANAEIALNVTGTLIQTKEGSIHLVPQADNLAVVSANKRFDRDDQAYKFGLLPTWVFAPATSLVLTEAVPTVAGDLRLTGRGGDRLMFVIMLGAECGYRMTRLSTFGEDGELLLDILLSDYRPVGTHLVPFQTVERFRAEGVEDCVFERRVVRQVEVISEVPARTFDVPADYRVQRIE